MTNTSPDLGVVLNDGVLTDHRSTQYGINTLLGLRGKHVYAGTVPEGVVANRRAANKAARKSRKTNR